MFLGIMFFGLLVVIEGFGYLVWGFRVQGLSSKRVRRFKACLGFGADVNDGDACAKERAR
jgi:hypothetical protein